MLDFWVTNRIKYIIIENQYAIGLGNRKTKTLYLITLYIKKQSSPKTGTHNSKKWQL